VTFEETPLAGTWVIRLEPHQDERGYFVRTFSEDAFRERGLDTRVSQTSLSWNHQSGTLRGMHYQASPHGESKLVSCLQGRIYDVALDLRPGSPSEGEWFSVELGAGDFTSLYVPEGVAHGFQTLEDSTLVHYQISVPQTPDAARIVGFDDPAYGIRWPLPVGVISERDAAASRGARRVRGDV
jgi:dTDP-4-dehydrorhamnose 3,5-epimerase